MRHKIRIFPLALMAIMLASCCRNQVWEQPEILYSNASLSVNSVERLSDQTVLHLTASLQPGDNFCIHPNTYLVGDNGKKYSVIGSKGITLGQWTPYLEDSKAFDLIFEPLKGRNQALDLIELNGWLLYGIHEASKPLKINPIQDKKAAVREEASFFQKGIGTLNGQFEGSSHPKIIEFFGYNAFQENKKQTCSVAEDGSFSLAIPLEHPILSYVCDESATAYYFFLEPNGQTQMRIDSTGLVHFPEGAKFGKLAEWLSNAEPLLRFPMRGAISAEEWETISVKDIISRITSHYETVQTFVDYISTREHFSLEEAHLLKQRIRIMAATDELSVDFYMPRTPLGEPMDSLARIRANDLADPSLYISLAQLDPSDWTAFSLNNDITILSNRYEFSRLMDRSDLSKRISKMVAADSAVFHQAGPSIFLQAAIMNPATLSQEVKIQEWIEESGYEPEGLVDFQKIRNDRLSALTSPYLNARYQATMDELLAEQGDRYDLPEGEATDIFRKLIEPFYGKWVYIDFWSTSCGPCRAGIEDSADVRKKIAGRDDIKLVFITGDKSTRPSAYQEYVAKNLDGEVSYLIPETQYMLLSTLFNFNGIPHNELVDPDGRIVCGKTIPRLGPSFLDEIESVMQ